MKNLIHSLIVGLSVSFSANAAPSYDAAREFSHAENPNGVWSYGFEDLAGTFNLMPRVAEVSPDVFFWQGGSQLFGEPTAGKNEGTEPFVINGTTVYEPGDFALHPGPSGERAVLRWTAPRAGLYRIEASFEGADPMTTTDAEIASGDHTLLSGNVTGNTIPLVYSGLVLLRRGDQIDFSVGWGNGAYEFDTTLTRVTISRTPLGQIR
jgi:hypothetical protein